MCMCVWGVGSIHSWDSGIRKLLYRSLGDGAGRRPQQVGFYVAIGRFLNGFITVMLSVCC